MLRSFRSLLVPAVVFCMPVVVQVPAARAQITRLDRQLERIDVAVSGMATITKGVSGTNYLGNEITQNAATTLGALVQVRYTKSPLIGFEGTYSYARFTQNFTGPSTQTSFVSPLGVQANASEYSFGYVAHLPSVLGFQPFASGGAGSTAFRPTPLGGEQLPSRARATYYYSFGIDDQLSRFFGLRAQFRQTFYKAPDFGQNYLTINRQTFTSEPSIGIYVKF